MSRMQCLLTNQKGWCKWDAAVLKTFWISSQRQDSLQTACLYIHFPLWAVLKSNACSTAYRYLWHELGESLLEWVKWRLHPCCHWCFPKSLKARICSRHRLCEKLGKLSKHVNTSDLATMSLTCFYGCLFVWRNFFYILHSVQYYLHI